MKQTILITFLTFLTILKVSAQETEIFAPGGKAIKGYDAVAFFKDAKPVKGKGNIAYKWKNATWLFSNKENLKDFKANPEKYAPQYGGYCAYGASQGHKAPIHPDTWSIVNDKLYFNYNADVQKLWNKDHQNLIEVADKKWERIKNK